MPRINHALHSLSLDAFRELYVGRGMSQSEIATWFGVSRAAVYRYMRKIGLSARSNAASQEVVNSKRFSGFTPRQLQLVLGSLLGDACLHASETRSNKTGVVRASYKLHFAHSAKYRGYLEAKHALLGVGVKTGKPTRIFHRKSGFGSDILAFTFSHTPTLQRLGGVCMDSSGHKVVTSAWCDQLTWEGVAWWFQDDGVLTCRGTRRTMATFCTDSFSLWEVRLLCSMLRRLGLHSPRYRLNAISFWGLPQFRIHIHGEDCHRLVHAILPYVSNCMLYKTRTQGTKHDYLHQVPR